MAEKTSDILNYKQTVGYYLYDCLSREGITEIFGVPGDYNFSLLDILEKYEKISFINCRNELNAGYAADGYARIKGLSALITTFGVGELSACNAVAGSYSEYVPVIHIVGGPKTMMQNEGRKMHHTLLDGDFGVFRKVYENITEYTTVITAENAAVEIPKAIQKSKETKKPVYLLIADDVANQITVKKDINMPKLQTDQKALQYAIKHMEQVINQAQRPVLISGVYVLRYNLQSQTQQIVERMNIPAVSMMMGKGSFDENHKNYIGLYAGSLGSMEVKNIVESSDCILAVGTIWSDYNTGSFTAKLDPANIIEIQPNLVKVGMAFYENIRIEDTLSALLPKLYKKYDTVPTVTFPYDESYGSLDEEITSKYYYPRFQQMLKENDILAADSGTFQFGLSELRLPKGAVYITQGGWGSIGYAPPAAFGAYMAAKDRRVILFTGDGSLQMTVQELSSMLVNGCKPIIFLVSNSEYTIEKYLNVVRKDTHYNDVPAWDYTKLMEAFGGESFKVKVRTNKELDEAIKEAEKQYMEKLCFIEIYTPKMDAPPMVHNIRQMLENKEKPQ